MPYWSSGANESCQFAWGWHLRSRQGRQDPCLSSRGRGRCQAFASDAVNEVMYRKFDSPSTQRKNFSISRSAWLSTFHLLSLSSTWWSSMQQLLSPLRWTSSAKAGLALVKNSKPIYHCSWLVSSQTHPILSLTKGRKSQRGSVLFPLLSSQSHLNRCSGNVNATRTIWMTTRSIDRMSDKKAWNFSSLWLCISMRPLIIKTIFW